jgi:hypothetical protein
MTVYFLVAIMIWHDDGDMFNRRYSVTAAPSGEACEITSQILRKNWQEEVPRATIMLECLPVLQGRKS